MYLYIYKEMVLWQQHPSVASFMTQGAGRLGQGGGGVRPKEDVVREVA